MRSRLVLALAIGATAPALASPTPLEDPLLVVSHPSGLQDQPAVATNAEGAFVVVWADHDRDQGDPRAVEARRFDSSGSALGSEFQINTRSYGAQEDPVVALADDGSFLALWSSSDGIEDPQVRGRSFGPEGQPLAADRLISDHANRFVFAPEVEALADGRFVATWSADDRIAARTIASSWDPSRSTPSMKERSILR